MNRKTRTRLEMAARALEFSRAHPDDSPGYVTAITQLQEQLARAQQLADQQREGIVETRATTAPYLAFTTVARTMIAEGQRQKDLLVKHGLVERVLDSLVESLGQFDRAVEQSAEGRRMHIGAGANLDVVGDEVLQIVKVIDGLNRFRFANDPNLLTAWRAASNVIGPPRTAEKSTTPEPPPAGGEIKPAA